SDEQLSILKEFSFIEKIEPVKTIVYKKSDYSKFTEIPKINLKSSYLRDYGASLTQNELSNIPKVHDLNITGRGVLIGVLDSGFEWKNHDALKSINVISEKDFVFNDNNTANQSGDDPQQSSHGTYCLSILSGYKEGSLIGSSFNSSFILAKTEDIRSENTIEEDNYAAALQWMENLGVDIVTSSLGYNELDNFSYKYSDMNGKTAICTKAAEIAFNKGVVTITSAGNEGNYEWRYITAPADGFNIISVGAVNSENIIASFSSRGPTYDGRIKPEVTAMGVGVLGCDAYSNAYRYASGTSSAAPIVAGVAGLLLSKYSFLNNKQIRNIILESSKNVKNPDNNIGYGLLDAYYAVNYPVLHKENDKYKLSKLLDYNNISNVIFEYCLDDECYKLPMQNKGDKVYEIELPNLETNKIIKFAFTFNNEIGTLKKIPESGTFKLKFGFLPIELNNKLYDDINLDYGVTISNYPNPFSYFTNIEFYSDAVSKIDIIIYDILGNKVRNLFSGISNIGINKFVWDGFNNHNKPCSSGVYIVTTNNNGKLISKKMLLIK
ncbi:MAG TPA: S8 family serine peptidase, partial [Melioribacteraceae bacterium]|nr:S8 family serine peptidase [Melioribacteraceae bacterium]